MALQSLKGGVFIPAPDMFQWSGAPSFNNSPIDAADEGVAAILAIPKTGNVLKILFSTRTVTTGATVTGRIETLDAAVTPATPSGTLYHANATGTLVVNSTDDNIGLTISFASAAPVTKGDKVAVIVKNPLVSFGNIQIADFADDVTNFPYKMLNTGISPLISWAVIARAPIVGLEYDDGSYEHIHGCWPITTITTTTYNNTSTPDEIGIRFQVAFPCRASGMWAYMDPDGDFNVNLYDSDGVTKIASTSYAVDKDVSGTTTAGYHFFKFATTANLTKDTYYRLVIEPSSATSLSLYDFTVLTAAVMDAFDGGQLVHLTSAKDPTGEGSWTNTTTRRPWMGLEIDAFDDAVGGAATGYVIGS